MVNPWDQQLENPKCQHPSSTPPPRWNHEGLTAVMGPRPSSTNLAIIFARSASRVWTCRKMSGFFLSKVRLELFKIHDFEAYRLIIYTQNDAESLELLEKNTIHHLNLCLTSCLNTSSCSPLLQTKIACLSVGHTGTALSLNAERQLYNQKISDMSDFEGPWTIPMDPRIRGSLECM